MSEAELAYGVALLPPGRRRDTLAQAIWRLLQEGLGGRVLPFDRAAAIAYGTFVAARRAEGRPVSTIDAQIAAIARTCGAARLATRDVAGLEGCGVALIDPWQPGAG